VSYTFTATDASSADQAAGFAWLINYGDGTGAQAVAAGNASPLAGTHTFTTPGTYSVTATATDKDAGTSTTATKSITIADKTAPQITSVPSNITTSATSTSGAAVTFSGATATDNSGAAPSISYSPASGSTFAIGTTPVTVTATDAAGNFSTATFSVTVGQLSQTITFNPSATALTTDTIALSATASSGLSVSLSVQSGPGSINGSNVLSFTGAGSVVVRASQAGNASYLAATNVDRTIVVSQASQTISFTLAATALTTDTIALSATGGASGNLVTFSVQSGSGSISGSDVLSFTGAGSVVVRASQAGNASYLEATNVDRTIVVSAAGGVTAVADRVAATSVSVLIDVLANDTDGANRPLTLTSVTQPAVGKVAIEGSKIRFTPKVKTSVTAPLTFTYTVNAGSDSATATVTLIPPPVGNYVGLLSRNGVVRGRLTATVSAGGVVTGAVRRDSAGFAFKGSIVNQARMSFARSASPVPSWLTLPLGALDSLGQPTLDVTIADLTPGEFLTGVAERSPYDTVHPAPQAGRYTLVADLPSGGNGPQTGAALACSIATNGVVTLGGRIGDNTAATHGGSLLSGGRFPFYAATGSGAVQRRMSGTLVFDRTASPAVAGTLHWKLPASVFAPLPAGVDQDYNLFGLPYTSAAGGAAMFNPTVLVANLTLGFPTPIVRRVGLDGLARNGSQRMYFTGGTGYVSPASGFFFGTHTPSKNVNRSFFGVVFQGGGINAGRGNLIDSNAIRPITLAP
jgi:hypothetical protein